MKELIENLKKMQFEHKKTLVNLKKENKLKSEELKAAQVRTWKWFTFFWNATVVTNI